MKQTKTIFVTGITGNQGSAVAKYLLEQNQNVIGLTRNANSDKAKLSIDKGVSIVEGNLNNPSSYLAEMQKADGIFFVQILQPKTSEIKEGKHFIDVVKSLDGTHFVYSSVLGADLNTGVPHFDSKFEIENYIKASGIMHTVLRPASFFENHLHPDISKRILKGKYITPLKKTCRQQMIGVDAIGKIAAQVFMNPDTYARKILSIATDEWLINDVPQLFSEALNKPVSYGKLPGIIARLAMGKDLFKMFKYMNQHNFSVVENTGAIKDEFGIEEDFKSWILEHFKPN